MLTQQNSRKLISAYIGYCLRHDVVGGFEFLKKVPAPSADLSRYIKRLENRLFLPIPGLRLKTKIPWIRALLRIFAHYYVDVLVKKIPLCHADKKVVESIETDVLQHCIDADSADEKAKLIDKKLAEKFELIGWHYLGGRTSPFLGPYIYEEQTEKRYIVDLPLGKRDLKVVFMKKFHSRSWLDFVTLGESGTGGWAKKDGLYCVEEVYDLESSKFKVNYLQHEAQHFDDYERFPWLQDGHQTILEYRAKLVELIYSETIATFRYFMKEAMDNPQNPHAYASWLIRKSLETKLQILSDAEIHDFNDLSAIKQAAGKSYAESTEQLIKRIDP